MVSSTSMSSVDGSLTPAVPMRMADRNVVRYKSYKANVKIFLLSPYFSKIAKLYMHLHTRQLSFKMHYSPFY